MSRRLVGFTALTIAIATAAGPGSKPELVTLTGTVVFLPEALKSTGLAFDAPPISRQAVLKAENGGITPLLSDDASRALFEDQRLRHRKSEIIGRKHPGLPYFQVMSFKIEDEGKLRTPEYYCEICSISVRFPQICPCCQGDMILRMQPELPGT